MAFDSTKIKGPKWLKTAFADVYDAIWACSPIGGIGTMVFDSPGGRVVNATGGRGVGAVASVSPFQILSNGENVGILPESTVFKNLRGDTLAITGMLTRLSDGTIDPADPGWFACPAIGEKIWLQIGTSDPAHTDSGPQPWATTTQVRYGEAGGSLWEEYPDPIAANSGPPAYQEYYNLLIAEVTDPATDTRPAILTVLVGEESRQITQSWSRNVSLVFWCVNGLLCLVPCDPAPDQIPTPI